MPVRAGFMAAVTLLLVLQALLLAPLAGALDNSLGKTPPCVTNAALAEPDWLTASPAASSVAALTV
jgi:hypothetical protein